MRPQSRQEIKEGSTVVYKNLINPKTNFLWYLKALFCWRIVLMMPDCLMKASMRICSLFSSQQMDVDQIETPVWKKVWPWLLLVGSLVLRSWDCLQPMGPEGPGFIGQTCLLMPFFVIGYLVFYKDQGNLLRPFVNYMEENPVLRWFMFAAYILLWIDACFFGVAQKQLLVRMSHFYFQGNVSRITVMMVRIFTNLAYGFIATSWLPKDTVPIITDAGKNTLYTYMFNTTGILCAYSLWRFVASHTFGPIWSTWLWFQPLLVIFWSSAAMRFLVWPLASPSGWALNLQRLSWETVTDEEWVKRLHPLVWLVVVVIIHAVFCLLVHFFGSPRECAVHS
jgi:hypothetical protein